MSSNMESPTFQGPPEDWNKCGCQPQARDLQSEERRNHPLQPPRRGLVGTFQESWAGQHQPAVRRVRVQRSFYSSPVSSQSTDLPNSRLMASNTAAHGSLSPCSSAERWLWATPRRRPSSSWVMLKPRSCRILRPIAGRSSSIFNLDFRLVAFILIVVKYLH